jgi:hypothetical protein
MQPGKTNSSREESPWRQAQEKEKDGEGRQKAKRNRSDQDGLKSGMAGWSLRRGDKTQV